MSLLNQRSFEKAWGGTMIKKIKNKKRYNLKSKVLFDHSLEEKKALQYLKNLINSLVPQNLKLPADFRAGKM